MERSGTMPPLVPGYRLAERLGEGSSGVVWAAVREHDAAPVAVKVVPVGVEESAQRAARELAVLAGVEVEGLVRLHEALGLAGDPPSVALVLERVAGGSLASAVAARGHLSVGESVTVLAPVSRALASLHAAGVVHGDVQPANVLLERSGRPLLADLGVARLTGEVPGALYGTLGFIAPEVAAGGAPTPASDVYAVGAMAWWCVTGAAPAPPALRAADERLPPALPQPWCEVTLRALSGDPAARPGAAELALAYFDAAPCEPLRLVVGSDETSLLTQRLRHAAIPDPPSQAGPGDGVRPSRGPTWWRAPSAARLSATRWRTCAGWATTPHERRGAMAALATLGLLAVLGCLALWWDGRGPGSERQVVPTVPVADGATSAGHAKAAPHRAMPDPTTDRSAPQRDPRGLMQALSDRRAFVVTSRQREELRLLDVDGSPAMAADAKLLEDLQASGQAYDGVGLQVRTSRLVGRAPKAADRDLVTVEAAVDTTAYTLVGKAGSREARPAVQGAPMRFDLRWVHGRWLVERVTAAPGQA